ncbi:MAG TPA: hypothetical protein DCS93_34280 [Microscillaceae bacterium]|nr:hypothetical protein [Microscillaceae bacterium]
MLMKKRFIIMMLLILSIYDQALWAQSYPVIDMPRVSQGASVTQRIGITDITIRYHRPGIDQRKLHQKSVAPYGQVWRAGANENTLIKVSHGVKIQGKTLPAGTYGLHIIPDKSQWTVIFSRNTSSWGSYHYRSEEDVLRIKAEVSKSPHHQWLTYQFTDIRPQSTTLSLLWGNTRASFDIEVEVPQIVLAHIRNQLRGKSGFFFQSYYYAARFCYTHKINTQEALTWIDRSISRIKTFQNVYIKAKLLAQAGKNKESKALEKEALANATERELIVYGYKFTDEKIKPYAWFDYIVKRFDTWTAYKAQGFVFLYYGDLEKARQSYQTALKKAPQEQKEQIRQILSDI